MNNKKKLEYCNYAFKIKVRCLAEPGFEPAKYYLYAVQTHTLANTAKLTLYNRLRKCKI